MQKAKQGQTQKYKAQGRIKLHGYPGGMQLDERYQTPRPATDNQEAQ